jgi:dihydrofolate reductase
VSKLIMWNLVTLDGLFEGPKHWDLEFHRSVWGDDLQRLSLEQLESADALLFGRVTYEGMAMYWRKAEGEDAKFMNQLPKIVVSRTLESADWESSILVREDPAQAVLELKQRGTRPIFVFGSANLSRTLIEANLFDEYRLLVCPVILGAGTPLFAPGLTARFTLLESRPFPSGGVLLRYAPA